MNPVQPLVSILINNYNYGRFVADAIDSALTQSYPRCEVIVVDDGSTDNSPDIISRFGSAIRSIFQANGGQASAFNTGFANCHGDIICFLDSDDVFLRHKVREVVDALQNGERQWYFHRLHWTDPALTPIPMPASAWNSGDYDFRVASRKGTLRFAPPSTSGISFTRPLMKQILPMPESIRITSDNYIKHAALALAPGYFSAEQSALQRIHGANAYTLNGDGGLKGDVLLKTAAGLREHFPMLRTASNRMYAEGLVLLWRSGLKYIDLYREARSYLSELTPADRLEVLTRFGIKTARHRIDRLRALPSPLPQRAPAQEYSESSPALITKR